jgi:hypothetical protein
VARHFWIVRVPCRGKDGVGKKQRDSWNRGVVTVDGKFGRGSRNRNCVTRRATEHRQSKYYGNTLAVLMNESRKTVVANGRDESLYTPKGPDSGASYGVAVRTEIGAPSQDSLTKRNCKILITRQRESFSQILHKSIHTAAGHGFGM